MHSGNRRSSRRATHGGARRGHRLHGIANLAVAPLAVMAGVMIPAASAWAEDAKPPASTSHGGRGADERSARLARGLRAYANGEHDVALAELRAAAEADGAAALLAKGYAAAAANEAVEAQLALERYLDLHGASLSVEPRTAVEAQLESLRKRTAYVTVRSNVRNADVLVDGVSRGSTPSPAILVTSGEHRIELRHPQLEPLATTVELEGRQDEVVTLDFAAPQASGAELSDPVRARGPALSLWLPWTTAGILTAGAAGLAVLTFTTSRSVDAFKRNPTATPSQIDDADTRVLSLAVTTGVISGLAVGTLGGSLYLTLSDSDEPSAAAKRSKPHVELRWSGTSMAVGGSF